MAAIAHHYDLSNEFYELLLDEHMAYSSAFYSHDDQSLHDAQTAKLDMICRKLDLQRGQRLLDVGCGWGSLILHAAQHYGVQCRRRHAVGASSAISSLAASPKRASPTESRCVRQDYRELASRASTIRRRRLGRDG